MEQETLRKVQLVQLEMAKEVKRICAKYKIKYFLDAGTLLGAVRHKGFIPWDDDLDIGMLRSEYERFLNIASRELDKQYFLQTWKNDDGFPYGFAKIRKKDTLYIETIDQKTKGHKEIWIDIFPYDVFPDSTLEQKYQGEKIMRYRYEMMMKVGMVPWERHKNIIKKILVFIKYIPYILLGKLHSKEHVICKAEKTMQQFNKTTTSYIYPQGGGIKYGKWIIPIRCIETLVMMPFEDDEFLVPAGYKEYLTLSYGDYMKLPPPEKRGNWHQIIEVKL